MKEKWCQDKLEQPQQVTRPETPPNISGVSPVQCGQIRLRTFSNSSASSGKDGSAITSNIDEYLQLQDDVKMETVITKEKEFFEPYSRRELHSKDGYQSTEELEMYEREKDERCKEISRVEPERDSSSASHRKSVSFDLTDQEQPVQDDKEVFVDEFLKREKLREISTQHYCRSEVKTDFGNKMLLEKPIKSILRSASPSSSSQFSTLERQRENVASWVLSSHERLVNAHNSEIEQENPFKKTFVSQEELREMKEIAKHKKSRPSTQYEPMQTKIPLKKPVSASTGNLAKPPVPPKPILVVKQADLVKNEALELLHQEQGDFVEFEHDPITNTIREIRPKSEFNPDGPLPPLPIVPQPSQIPTKSKVSTQLKLQRPPSTIDRPKCSPPPPPTPKTPLFVESEIIEILPAKYQTLPKMETAKIVHESHENSKENILVPDNIRRSLLLQENDLRNALIIDSNANVDSDTDTNNNLGDAYQGHYSETASQGSSTGPSTSGVFSPSDFSQRSSSRIPVLNPHNVFPATQILPVHYTQLPTPQQPGYCQTVPVNTQIQLCQATSTQVTVSTPVVSLTYPQSTYYTTPVQCHLPMASLPSPILYYNNIQSNDTFSQMTNERQDVILQPQEQHLHQHWNYYCPINQNYTNTNPFFASDNIIYYNKNELNYNHNLAQNSNTSSTGDSGNKNNNLMIYENTNFTHTDCKESIFQVETGFIAPIEMYRNTEVEQVEILSTGTSSGVMSPIPQVSELTPINIRNSYDPATLIEQDKSPKMKSFGKETEV